MTGPAAGWQQAPLVGTVPALGMLRMPGTVTRTASRSTELLMTGVWLVVSLAGTGFGIALSAALISMLR